MITILITGGAGFIGSHLIRSLLNAGIYKVVCFDNFNSYYSRKQKELNIRSFFAYNDFTLVEGDICEQDDLKRLHHIDVIIHLASCTGVRNSFENPQLYHKVNVVGAENLLKFARDRKVGQFIFASSSSIYGNNSDTPWKEDSTKAPLSPYARSKQMAEEIGKKFSEEYGIRFLALRFFTVYGPGQRPDQAIHNFFKLCYDDRPINLFGDGSSTRDYTFVADVVEGIKAAIEYTGSVYETFNLASSKPRKLIEVIDLIESIATKKIDIAYVGEARGDAQHTYGNIEKAETLLGFSPVVSLESGLKAFNQWFKMNRCCIS